MDPAKLLMSSRIAVLKRPRTVIRALAFARHDHGAGALPSHFHVRALSSSALPKMASSVASPRFSAGSDLDTAGKTLALLLTSGGGRWMLTENGEGLERTFKFKTFAKTWDFMTAVSLQCKLKNHHPEWSNVSNTTFIRWTTHNPKGLSAKDLDLAVVCDALARGFGEVVEESPNLELSSLADKAVGSSAACCTPQK